MNTLTLKPSWSKIILSWLIMATIVFVGLVLTSLQGETDFLLILIGFLFSFFGTFAFMLIFYHLPYFKIEVSDAYLSGPNSIGIGWMRGKIAIADIDLQKTDAKLRWLGFYMIKSRTGGEISLWGFDEKQYQRLISLLRERKGMG